MQTVFRNRMAAVLWVFAAVWMAILVAMTHVLLRDGPPDGYPPLVVSLVFVVFWVAGSGLVIYVAGRPCVTVEVGPAGAVVTWRYPHRVERRALPAAGIGPAQVFESEDDEGVPYFHARVGTPDAGHVDIGEGHDRAVCAETCARFNAALQAARRS